MTLIYLGCAWLAGILLGSLLHWPLGFVGLLALLPVAGLLLWRKDQRIRLTSACFLALLLGTLRSNASVPPKSFNEGHLAHYNNQGWVRIEGIVSGEPDVQNLWYDVIADRTTEQRAPPLLIWSGARVCSTLGC